VIHSNGYINPKPLNSLCHAIDAANIDLKSFSEPFYREQTGGSLSRVLETLKTLQKNGIHLEITTLIIPTLNDDIPMIRQMCSWIKKELSPTTPIHFTRFYPLYKLAALPPTPVGTLEKARAAALNEGLEYVYIGNIPGHEGANTFCPGCGKLIIRRAGFMTTELYLDKGKCRYCGRPIPGIWSGV
jgi:pyruvate formate lyase activating enzyme